MITYMYQRDYKLHLKRNAFISDYQELCEKHKMRFSSDDHVGIPVMIDVVGGDSQQIGWMHNSTYEFQPWTYGWARVVSWRPE